VALSNADNPVAEKPAKAVKPAPEPAVAVAGLRPAGEATSPDVHFLIANRHALVAAGETEAVAAIDAQLASFGFYA